MCICIYCPVQYIECIIKQIQIEKKHWINNKDDKDFNIFSLFTSGACKSSAFYRPREGRMILVLFVVPGDHYMAIVTALGPLNLSISHVLPTNV